MRLRQYLIPFVVTLALCVGGLYALVSNAEADAAAEVLADAGVGDPVVASDHAPSAAKDVDNTIDDPIKNPGLYFDDVKAARKIGWPLLAIVLLTGALMVASKWVPWLQRGRRLIVVSGATTALMAAGNAGLAGGEWMAMATACALAALAYWQSNREVARAEAEARKLAAGAFLDPKGRG